MIIAVRSWRHLRSGLEATFTSRRQLDRSPNGRLIAELARIALPVRTVNQRLPEQACQIVGVLPGPSRTAAFDSVGVGDGDATSTQRGVRHQIRAAVSACAVRQWPRAALQGRGRASLCVVARDHRRSRRTGWLGGAVGASDRAPGARRIGAPLRQSVSSRSSGPALARPTLLATTAIVAADAGDLRPKPP